MSTGAVIMMLSQLVVAVLAERSGCLGVPRVRPAGQQPPGVVAANGVPAGRAGHSHAADRLGHRLRVLFGSFAFTVAPCRPDAIPGWRGYLIPVAGAGEPIRWHLTPAFRSGASMRDHDVPFA